MPKSIKKSHTVRLSGSPKQARTADTTVKGWCLNHLTMGPRTPIAENW